MIWGSFNANDMEALDGIEWIGIIFYDAYDMEVLDGIVWIGIMLMIRRFWMVLEWIGML